MGSGSYSPLSPIILNSSLLGKALNSLLTLCPLESYPPTHMYAHRHMYARTHTHTSLKQASHKRGKT